MIESANEPTAARRRPLVVRAGLGLLPGDLRRDLAHRIRRLQRPAWRGARHGLPVSDHWGWDRGEPVDRYYVDAFLAEHAADITGRVLEVRDRRYTERWGSGVTASDVLDIDPDLPGVTWVGDLAGEPFVPDGSYDCLILTQVLQFVYDVPAAVRNAHRLLAPGGVLLLTVPVISRLSHSSASEQDFWRFTEASVRRLVGEVFGGEAATVEQRGNLRATIAFLRGMSRQELPAAVLDDADPLNPLLVCARAVKSGG